MRWALGLVVLLAAASVAREGPLPRPDPSVRATVEVAEASVEAARPSLEGSGERHAAVAVEEEGASLFGRVLDAEGAPVADVRVLAEDPGDAVLGSAVSGPDGTFRLRPSEPPSSLRLVAPDGRAATVGSWKPERPGAPFRVRLHEVGPLEGTVRVEATGTPVAGALVRAFVTGFGTVRAETDPEGSFRLVVPTDLEFELVADGHERGQDIREHVRFAPNVRIEMLLPEVHEVAGRVVEVRPDGRRSPVEGVRVQAHRGWSWSFGNVRACGRRSDGVAGVSGPDGSFVCRGVVVGSDVCIESERWASSPRWTEVAEGACVEIAVRPKEPESIEVRRPLGDASIAGRVVDEAGAGVEGVEVSASQDVAPAGSGADGRFRLTGLARGKTSLEFSKEHHVTARRTDVEVASADVALETVVLRRMLVRRVHVRDEADRPVLSADVGSIPVDESGCVTAEVEPEEGARLLIRAPGFAPVQTESGDVLREEDLVVRLARGIPLCARLLDERGRPVAGVVVRTGNPVGETVTDLDGRFGFDLPREGPWPLFIHDSRFPTRRFAAGGAEIRIVPPTFRTLSGRLVDPAGRPVGGVTLVAADAEYDETHRTETDAEGRFRFDRILGERCRLRSASADEEGPPWGLRSTGDLEVGPSEVLVVAERLHTVRGWVVDPRGLAVRAADVAVSEEPEGCAAPGAVTSDDRGGFVLHGFLAGTYRLRVEAWEERGDDLVLVLEGEVEVEAGRSDVVVRLREPVEEEE